MLFADGLKQGDGIADPPHLRGKAYLEDKGFKVIEGKLTGQQDFYQSGSIKERVEEFNRLIHHPEVQCIMAAIGGMNSNSLLPYIDYQALKRNPKIIIGYSDVTALLLGVYAQTGLVTYYGPAMVSSFGELPPFVDLTYTYFKEALMGEISVTYSMPQPPIWTEEYVDWESQSIGKKADENKWLTVQGGEVTGRLVGGNLNTMEGIWGSEYLHRRSV